MEIEHPLREINNVHRVYLVQQFKSHALDYSNRLLTATIRTGDCHYMSFTVSLFEVKSATPGKVLKPSVKVI